jgi:hypothetical protein
VTGLWEQSIHEFFVGAGGCLLQFSQSPCALSSIDGLLEQFASRQLSQDNERVSILPSLEVYPASFNVKFSVPIQGNFS